MKKAIISIVWGELFPDLFKVFFMEIPESQTKQGNSSFPKPQALRIPPNVTVVSFERINDNHFDLQEGYILKLSDGLSDQLVFVKICLFAVCTQKMPLSTILLVETSASYLIYLRRNWNRSSCGVVLSSNVRRRARRWSIFGPRYNR